MSKHSFTMFALLILFVGACLQATRGMVWHGSLTRGLVGITGRRPVPFAIQHLTKPNLTADEICWES